MIVSDFGRSYEVLGTIDKFRIAAFTTANGKAALVPATSSAMPLVGALGKFGGTVGTMADIDYVGAPAVVLGGPVVPGDELTSNASGAAIKATALGQFIFGVADEAGVAGDIIPYTPTRGRMSGGLSSALVTLGMDAAMVPAQAAPYDNAPDINTRLNYLAASGGGVIEIPRGTFNCATQIVVPSACGLRGKGKRASVLRKSATWSADEALVAAFGAPGPANGVNHKVDMTFDHIALSGGDRPGKILDLDYASTCDLISVRFSGAPGTALTTRELWDSVFVDVTFNNCGGPLGAADAACRILGSPAYAGPLTPTHTGDKANLLRWFGTRFETFKNMALYVSDDGAGANSWPFGISFHDTKFESQALVSNAIVALCTTNCGANLFGDTILNFGAQAAATGIRGLCGFTVIEKLLFNIGNNVTLVSVARLPHSAGKWGRVTGGKGAGPDPTCLIEIDQLRDDGNTVVYADRSMTIDYVAPLGTIPLFGGTGAASRAYRAQQLFGTPAAVATGPRGLGTIDANRIIPVNGAAGGDWAFQLYSDNGAAVGDTITLWQQGARAAAFAAQSGVTIDVPAGKSLVTGGAGTMNTIRKVASAGWVVI